MWQRILRAKIFVSARREDVKGNKRSERQKREKRFFFVLFRLKMENEKEGACSPDGDSFYGRSFNVLKDPASAQRQLFVRTWNHLFLILVPRSPSRRHSPNFPAAKTERKRKQQTSCQVYKIFFCCLSTPCDVAEASGCRREREKMKENFCCQMWSII